MLFLDQAEQELIKKSESNNSGWGKQIVTLGTLEVNFRVPRSVLHLYSISISCIIIQQVKTDQRLFEVNAIWGY